MNAFPRSRLALVAVIAALCTLRTHAQSPQLVWSDDFNLADGSLPDATKWTYDLGGGGWGNNELETYTSSTNNVHVVSDPLALDGKALAITAIKSGSGSNPSYTSARIKTEGLYSFTYGRMEIRARLPGATTSTGASGVVGLWPAFWALGNDINTVSWPACGEIDTMEWVGTYPYQNNGSLHDQAQQQGLTATYDLANNTPFGNAYHVFAVDWYPSEIVFSVDGNVYETQPGGTPFNLPFFMIINMAVGGSFPGSPNSNTVFPQDLRIDYVKVYSLPTTPPAKLVYPPAPPTGVSAYAQSTAPTVNISWTAPTDTFGAPLTGYQVQRATDAGFTQNITSWNTGLSTTFVDTSAQAGTTYYYEVSAVSANGTSTPSAPVAATTNAAGTDAKMLNISTRGVVGKGSNVMIAGFVIQGATPKTVLIRASGPALAAFGVSGTLPDPQLILFQSDPDGSSTQLGTNAGWNGSASITAAASQVGAFAWSNSASLDSALLVTLNPGAYTAEVEGASGDTGVALVEVYDVPSESDTSKLINISSRGMVGTGSNVMIAGFVIGGSSPKTVLVRASGPALSGFGVSGVLPDPELLLYKSNSDGSSTLLDTNSGWGGDVGIASAAGLVGAFPWTSSTSDDAAVLVTLSPGAYTAEIEGASNDTGVSLVEVYDVP